MYIYFHDLFDLSKKQRGGLYGEIRSSIEEDITHVCVCVCVWGGGGFIKKKNI